MKPLDPIAFLSSRKSVGRWGDGEWHSVLGRSGKNVDKCRYEVAMPALRACLRSKDDAVMAIQPFAHRSMWPQIRKWLKANAPHRLKEPWFDAHYMVDLVKQNRMHEFVKELSKYKSCLIGPAHLRRLDITDHFIEVPARDAITKPDPMPSFGVAEVILGAAGFLGSKLAHTYSNYDVTYMDVGSAFDPYAGKKSRNTWTKLVNSGKLKLLK